MTYGHTCTVFSQTLRQLANDENSLYSGQAIALRRDCRRHSHRYKLYIRRDRDTVVYGKRILISKMSREL